MEGRRHRCGLDDLALSSGGSVSCIRRARRLDEQEMCFLLRPRTVTHTLGHHENLPGAKRDVALGHLDDETAGKDEEEVIGIGVLVPDELALDFDDHEIVAVELTDSAWLPVLVKRGQLLLEVDWLHGRGCTQV